ncbi:DUF3786 domain-containing protein [Desulfosporosinus sp. OT]|uniref:DUF3786 domain-containing protein n=1 Tax=Desulfosporosinus sp. OT TaxID=913865 RepID=UPI0002239E09|nr:DUF3786 domain-containing protein [Desulfosporosinus sp. OT]EGW40800.1 hypothetical protein DOT_1268 [Desulfosporosinus sp. OT]
MAKEELKKYRDALEHAKREFAKRSLSKILDLSGAEPQGESGLVIRYGGALYQVQYPGGDISPCELKEHGDGVEITDRILILQYLTEVCGVQPSGKWISFREVPWGNNHYAAFKLEAMEPLAKRFGSSPAEFELACQKLGGKKLAMGDRAFAIPVFPKLQLAFILWLADEEWPARANILFDATASMHLNTEGLEVLGINTAERIISLSDRQEE